MHWKVSDHVDGGPSRESSVHRPKARTPIGGSGYLHFICVSDMLMICGKFIFTSSKVELKINKQRKLSAALFGLPQHLDDVING